jgi:hypothetical protein
MKLWDKVFPVREAPTITGRLKEEGVDEGAHILQISFLVVTSIGVT